MELNIKPDYVISVDNDNYYVYVLLVEGELDRLISIINEMNNDLKQIIQIIKPNSILSLRQLALAIYHTVKSFRKRRNIARKPYLELLLRLSGQKQIRDALASIGLPSKAVKACLIVILHEACKHSLQELIHKVKSLNIKIKSAKEYFITPSALEGKIDFQKIFDIERERIAKSALLDLL